MNSVKTWFNKFYSISNDNLSDVNVFLVGDFNDHIHDVRAHNVFQEFIDVLEVLSVKFKNIEDVENIEEYLLEYKEFEYKDRVRPCKLSSTVESIIFHESNLLTTFS